MRCRGLGKESNNDEKRLPFISPDDVDLEDWDDERSSKNPSDDHSIHNLIPLLIHTPRDHHHQIFPSVLHYSLASFSVLPSELQAGAVPQTIRLLPEVTLLASFSGDGRLVFLNAFQNLAGPSVRVVESGSDAKLRS